MANWVKCTLLEGDEAFLNFDTAVYIHRNVQTNSTRVDLVGETHSLMIKETIDELRELGVPLNDQPGTNGSNGMFLQRRPLREHGHH